MIPYGRQSVDQADIDAVIEVLRSDWLTQGPAVPRFEELVSSRVGASHAVAVNSATSALHVACFALGLGPGDLLWTVPNTFVASANCGRYCGADVDFVDIDPDTWNISLTALRDKLHQARKRSTLPKVLVPVHFSGQPTDQEEIRELSNEFGFSIIEDASHAIGAERNGERVGSCRWSDITVFSFHPVKIVTTAEGGMALTNDADLAERMQMFRSHGITRDSARMTHEPDGPWYFQQQFLGFNYRLTDLQAALGVSQLRRLDEFLDRRNTLARRYDSLLDGLPLQLPHVKKGNRSSFHLYVVRLRLDEIGLDRHAAFEALRAAGIGVNVHYIPVHRQPYYEELGFQAGDFPNAERYYEEALTLPLYPTLSDAEQDQVVAALRRVLC